MFISFTCSMNQVFLLLKFMVRTCKLDFKEVTITETHISHTLFNIDWKRQLIKELKFEHYIITYAHWLTKEISWK